MPLNPQALGNGHEQYKYFNTPNQPGKSRKVRVQYDYRHTDGKLFSCVASSEEARSKRDIWAFPERFSSPKPGEENSSPAM